MLFSNLSLKWFVQMTDVARMLLEKKWNVETGMPADFRAQKDCLIAYFSSKIIKYNLGTLT